MSTLSNLISMFRSAPPPDPSSARYLQQNTRRRSIIMCGPITVYDPDKDFTRRVDFDETITVYGWPSRGGVILLENASVADFNFLELDRLNPTMLRCKTREEEDVFSKRLLLLGAKWWDSVARYWLLNSPDSDIAELDNSPSPTMKERYWVSVAWPSTSTGELIVAEYDTNMYGVGIETDTVPDDVFRLMLCTTMDEKARMLMERFGGKVWKSVNEYEGNACIGCWGEKDGGEVGQLLQTWSEG